MEPQAHGPGTVRISAASHRLRVVAEDGGLLAVDGSARVAPGGDATTIDQVRSKLTVRVPAGADVLIGATSGRVEIEGPVGHVGIVSRSGRVEVDNARSVDVRTESSAVEVRRVRDACRVRTTTGRVEIGSCGSADVSTRSGRIEVAGLDGPGRVHCVSGRIEVGLVSAADVDAESVTGRIQVTYPPGTRVHRADRAGGPLRPPDADCTLAVRSVTGAVEVSTG